MRLKNKFDGTWGKYWEVERAPRKKDGVVITEITYFPVINGELKREPIFNPRSHRPLRRKRWIARLGDVVSSEHETRKAAIDEIAKRTQNGLIAVAN